MTFLTSLSGDLGWTWDVMFISLLYIWLPPVLLHYLTKVVTVSIRHLLLPEISVYQFHLHHLCTSSLLYLFIIPCQHQSLRISPIPQNPHSKTDRGNRSPTYQLGCESFNFTHHDSIAETHNIHRTTYHTSPNRSTNLSSRISVSQSQCLITGYM